LTGIGVDGEEANICGGEVELAGRVELKRGNEVRRVFGLVLGLEFQFQGGSEMARKLLEFLQIVNIE
jgi:hypothetical protein